MIIKSKEANFAYIMGFFCIVGCFITMVLGFNMKGRDIAFLGVYYLGMLFLLIRGWIAYGRTIVMNETGCTVSFLWYKKTYRWNELKVKRIENYENCIGERNTYKKGAIFSPKEINRPKWLKVGAYCVWVHPISVFYVYFTVESPRFTRYGIAYEIDEAVFREKMLEWGIELQEENIR